MFVEFFVDAGKLGLSSTLSDRQLEVRDLLMKPFGLLQRGPVYTHAVGVAKDFDSIGQGGVDVLVFSKK